MVKVFIKDSVHFSMTRKTHRKDGTARDSLIAQFNDVIPGLAEAFDRLFKRTAKERKPSMRNNEAFKQFQTAQIEQELYELFGYDYDLSEYTVQAVGRAYNNICHRTKLFKRKAGINSFNYFVTFTYDSAKHTEESFRRALKKCLNNLHSRRGWLCMGKFERSDTERLHFHGFIYVPEGEMVGTLFNDTSYDFKSHKRVTNTLNSFFCERFGRADFEELTDFEVKHSKIKEYILKYIHKDLDEKLFYSRGIASCLEVDMPIDDDKYVVATLLSVVKSYLLSDTTFYCDKATNQWLMNDYSRNVTHNRIRLAV